ncbi:MAG TPA: glycosyltransferase family A protein [Rhizomicrobium sp.]
MRDKLAAGFRRARSALPRKLAALRGVRYSRTPGDLRALNADLSKRAKNDLGGWLAQELQFALDYECYETAERLARYALAIWAQFAPARQQQFVAPIAEAFIAIGARDDALTFLNVHRHALRNDDRIAGIFAVLANDTGAQPALLPSGKLNAYALSCSATKRAEELHQLYKSKPHLFERDPQNLLLLCNAARETSPTHYREFLNRFLAKYDAGEITSLEFSSNMLTGIAFRPETNIVHGPRVSVIMSAFNSAGTITYAMKSVLDQNYRNVELLVCDDASNDGTMDAIRAAAGSDARVRIFRSRRNQGTYNIRNALVREASGDYITFRDSDDLALPSRIGRQLQNLIEKKASAAVGRWIRMRPSGEVIFFRDRSALRNCLVSIMAPKAVFLRYGPYRSVRFGGDTEFKERIRIAQGDAAVLQLPQPIVFGLWSSSSLTQSGGGESFADGYRGPKRRRFSEITTRQRLLGEALVPETEITEAFVDEEILVEPSGIDAVNQA